MIGNGMKVIQRLPAVVLVVGALAIALLVSCQQQTSQPLPTSTPFNQLYEFYQGEIKNNPTRLEKRVDDKELRVFHGPITNIEGSKVQFHVERRLIERDKYMECRFRAKESVLHLNVGDRVTVYGYLDGANDVVKFKDCGFKRA